MTATVIATLVEEGKLNWTTTLADAFPDLRDSMSDAFRGATIDLLLSHHAGIPPFTDTDAADFKSIPKLEGTPEQQRAAFAAWVLRGKPAGPIGEKGLYSNGGFSIAGAIAERITGKSWETLVRERVFKPLDLEAAFAWSETPDLKEPWGHRETRRGTKPLDPRDERGTIPPIIWPAGSVEISLDDYARFLQVHLRGLEGRDTALLKAATIKHLHSSPVSPADNFGLGWGLQDVDSAPSSVHVGSAGAFVAITILQPTRDLGVAVFTNAGGERSEKAVKEAAKELIRRFAAAASK
jgi:CubicO group peptidase (beta-lactamase class C family)